MGAHDSLSPHPLNSGRAHLQTHSRSAEAVPIFAAGRLRAVTGAQKPSKRDKRVGIGIDPEDAPRTLLKVDPDAPPAKPNADEPVAQDEPVKDQGDRLDGE